MKAVRGGAGCFLVHSSVHPTIGALRISSFSSSICAGANAPDSFSYCRLLARLLRRLRAAARVFYYATNPLKPESPRYGGLSATVPTVDVTCVYV